MKKINVSAGIGILDKSIREFNETKDTLSAIGIERERAEIRGQASMLYWINAITFEEFTSLMDKIAG